VIKTLNDNRQFSKLNHFGSKVFNPNFILVVCDKSLVVEDNIYPGEKHYCYYGIRISKKVGNAVVRNKIRRRIKSIIYNLYKSTFLEGKALLCVPKTRCAIINFDTLSFQIKQSIEKINLL